MAAKMEVNDLYIHILVVGAIETKFLIKIVSYQSYGDTIGAITLPENP